MRNEAVFLECSEEFPISKTSAPEFYRLYQQAVLLALKEQDVLDDMQLQYCLNLLDHRHEKYKG